MKEKMNNLKILILGSSGLVGSSLVRTFDSSDEFEVIGANRDVANLFSFNETSKLIKDVLPNVVINAAARVGGIVANNTNRTEFILENLKININVLESLINHPEIRLINLGSSCIYPLDASNPIDEDSLMTGPLEPTNSPYAMAKLTAIEMGNALKQQYGHEIVNLMPTNLYGPNDNFSPTNSHVIPGLIYKMHKAKLSNDEVFKVWGTGKPLREFLYVDDLSDAIKFIVNNNVVEEVLNIGSGNEVTINQLVEKLKDIISFRGEIVFDDMYPDGNPRKLLNSNKMSNLGWESSTDLVSGLEKTYSWFKENINIT
jgi:GDP-L-fucose synthase